MVFFAWMIFSALTLLRSGSLRIHSSTNIGTEVREKIWDTLAWISLICYKDIPADVICSKQLQFATIEEDIKGVELHTTTGMLE